ncbi:MAG: hypothetical protein LUQ26_09960 [Methylococcaceae bacterium]|nr:hypothetical protein [Methylococcaceae bacterium]
MSAELNNALEVLHSIHTQRIEFLKDWVSKGTAKDYAEYREICGQIVGLLEACRNINELYHETVEGDEDDQ